MFFNSFAVAGAELQGHGGASRPPFDVAVTSNPTGPPRGDAGAETAESGARSRGRGALPAH